MDVENNMLNGERLRQCSTAFEAPSILNDSSVDIVTKVYDRDAFGSVSICQKGAYKLLGKPISEYETGYNIYAWTINIFVSAGGGKRSTKCNSSFSLSYSMWIQDSICTNIFFKSVL